MNQPDMRTITATWPARESWRFGPWEMRDGDGGGQRCSATLSREPITLDDVQSAVAEMRGRHQTPLFCVDDAATDDVLAQSGLALHDPCVVYARDNLHEIAPPPPVSTFEMWPPLAIGRHIWAQSDIGAARLRVMARVQGPKTAILSRTDERASGVLFVACHGSIAMVHALTVVPKLRRRSAARHMLQQAAIWAHAQGAEVIATVTRQENAAARALFTGFQMTICHKYHYRIETGVSQT